MRIAVIGSGFWAQYQVAGWQVLPGVQVAALYNRTRPSAEALAKELHVGAVYDDAEETMRREKPDAVDVVTDVDTHPTGGDNLKTGRLVFAAYESAAGNKVVPVHDGAGAAA